MHSAMVAADELCRWALYIAPGATAWERCGCGVLQSTVDDTSVPPILRASIVTTMIKATKEVPSGPSGLAAFGCVCSGQGRGGGQGQIWMHTSRSCDVVCGDEGGRGRGS